MREKEELHSPEKKENIPIHVAFIMDGNRRWAELHNLPATVGHDVGRKQIEPLIRRCIQLGIEVVTFYTLSLENLDRSEEEVSGLFRLIRKYAPSTLDRLTEEDGRFRLLGDIARFPPDLQDLFRDVEEKTKEKRAIRINFALAYGGRDEIVRAFKRIIEAGINKEEVTEELVANYLDTAGQPDPELIIRTGGRRRLSGYLPWQGVYSELYFTDALWPDFTVDDFDKAILWYQAQKRTFGH